ncbi:MAG: polysaccharide biosynthesis tyrosine autokinase [Oscillospiraceae bacterium]
MDYNANAASASEEGLNIDSILMYFQKLLKKWWVIALIAVIVATVAFAATKLSYVPMYSSGITFIASNKAASTTVGGQTQGDISASAALAESFKYVFTTNELSTAIAQNCGYKLSGSEIKNFVSVEAVKDTAIIYLTAKTTDPEVSYAIAKTYADNYAGPIKDAFPSTNLIIIDPPLLSKTPVPNNSVLVNTLLGFLIGAFIAAASIIVLVIMKDTIKSTDDVKTKIGIKVIGTVNKVQLKEKKKDSKKSLLITDKKCGFAFIESYKLIRTKIEHLAMRENHKTFIVTSTMENEGKTTNAVNIALALAKNGKSVLLIDADLRKPAVAKALAINASEDKGVEGIINGEKTLAESIKYSEKYNLFLLMSGRGIVDPSEILSTNAMEEVIEAAEKEFDYVVIDTPPCGVVADAVVIAGYADAIIMIIRQDVAPMRRVARAIENLDNSGTEIIGCIFNDSDSGIGSTNSYSYGKKYGYGYGYGYGYSGNTPKQKK